MSQHYYAENKQATLEQIQRFHYTTRLISVSWDFADANDVLYCIIQLKLAV